MGGFNAIGKQFCSVLLGCCVWVFWGGKILKSVHKCLGKKATDQTHTGNESNENLLTTT